MRPRRQIIIITAFAIAMGLLESAVVIYLRHLFYPGGFEFPLSPIPVNIAVTEVLREAATLVMLVSIGMLAGRSFSTGFAWFIYSFAVWDIFFYVFLRLLGYSVPDPHHLDRSGPGTCTGLPDHDRAGPGDSAPCR